MQSHGRDAMKKDIVDELVHDTSTQGKVIGNDGSLPQEISIHDSNQDDDDDGIDNMFSKAENEYAIMKFNCKAIEEMCEDNPDREPAFTRELDEWNWYHWNRTLRGQINEQHR
eukprot:10407748-Ditylum_brightwellii.AAC.1